MSKDDRVYLHHIRDAIARIQEYREGIDYETFMQTRLLQDGIIRQLEIIGEATKRLSDAFTTRHDVIPWRDMAGMRDKLIHNYLGVDLDAVWETVQRDLPPLKALIENALKENKE